jgi:hypothetical protein
MIAYDCSKAGTQEQGNAKQRLRYSGPILDIFRMRIIDES